MKRMLSLLLVLSLLLACSSAMAAGMGIQAIGGPQTEGEPVSLEDLPLNTSVEIAGYGILCATDFAFKDILGFYRAGKTSAYTFDDVYQSGVEAEFAMLRMNIVNTATKPRNFLTSCSVKVVFDHVYEYNGWFYQYNYNNEARKGDLFGDDSQKQNTNWVIHPDDQFAIDPMYEGHFVFGCTLPNAVVNSKKPLQMIITIDGSEITYNIRK